MDRTRAQLIRMAKGLRRAQRKPLGLRLEKLEAATAEARVRQDVAIAGCDICTALRADDQDPAPEVDGRVAIEAGRRLLGDQVVGERFQGRIRCPGCGTAWWYRDTWEYLVNGASEDGVELYRLDWTRRLAAVREARDKEHWAWLTEACEQLVRAAEHG